MNEGENFPEQFLLDVYERILKVGVVKSTFLYFLSDVVLKSVILF